MWAGRFLRPIPWITDASSVEIFVIFFESIELSTINTREFAICGEFTSGLSGRYNI